MRTPRLWTIAAAATLAITAAVALPAHADETITSAGPLTSIMTTSSLNCAVEYAGDTHPEWFGTVACGTFVAVAGTIYGPDRIPAGDDHGGYTTVSQTKSGSGTSASPYKTTTVVNVGSTGLKLTQVDTYVVGSESYPTSITLQNTGSSAVSAIVYRGGDCYLQESDYGRGRTIGDAPVCQAQVDAVAPNRIIAYYPTTAGSSFFVGAYDELWDAIASGTALPNECYGTAGPCNTPTTDVIDNGIGLSWSVNIPAGASRTVSHVTAFSPLGSQPIGVDVTGPGTGSVDVNFTRTVKLTNNGEVNQSASSATFTLPDGVSYVSSSVAGATVSGNVVTIPGPIALNAHGNYSFTLTLKAAAAGTYDFSATANGTVGGVLPAEHVAPITIAGGPEPTETPTTPEPTDTPTTPEPSETPTEPGPPDTGA